MALPGLAARRWRPATGWLHPQSVTNARRARYRGLPKTRLEHNTMAAALNLIRLDAWFNGETLDPRRSTHLS